MAHGTVSRYLSWPDSTDARACGMDLCRRVGYGEADGRLIGGGRGVGERGGGGRGGAKGGGLEEGGWGKGS